MGLPMRTLIEEYGGGIMEVGQAVTPGGSPLFLCLQKKYASRSLWTITHCRK